MNAKNISMTSKPNTVTKANMKIIKRTKSINRFIKSASILNTIQ